MSGPDSIVALVELYSNVAIMDGGLMPYHGTYAPIGLAYDNDSGLSGYSLTQSNDKCTIFTGTGSNDDYVGYVKDLTNLGKYPFLSNTYPRLAVRAKALGSNSSWCAVAYDGAVNIGGIDWQTNTDYTTYSNTIASGNTIDSIVLYARTTDGANASVAFEYLVISDTTPTTLEPSDIDITKRLTNGYSNANLLLDYTSAPTISIHDDIVIYLDKDTITAFDNCVFSGKVRRIEKLSSGQDARWLQLHCADYSCHMYDIIGRVTSYGLASSIITDFMNPIMTYGYINGMTLDIDDATIEISYPNGENVADSIKDICSSKEQIIDADWRVTPGGIFEAFTIGSKQNLVNVAEHATSFDYILDSNKVINTIEVFGAFSETIGTDADFSESTVNWGASGILKLNSENPQAGDYTIVSSMDEGDSELWLERTFPSTLSLNPEAKVAHKFYIFGELVPSEVEHSLVLTTYFYEDDANYFYINHTSSGADETKDDSDLILLGAEGNANGKLAILKWSEISYYVGSKVYKEYGKVGNPHWEYITKYRFEVMNPELTKPAVVHIDDMNITSYYYGVYGDIVSQSLYGVRYGEPQINTNLLSDSACTLAASLIVTPYTTPLVMIDNLDTLKNFEVDVGEEVIFNTLDINTTLTVREIRHRLKSFELNTEIDLSPRFVPSNEDIIANFRRKMEVLNWDTKTYTKIMSSAAIAKRGNLIDWWDVNADFSAHAWTNSRTYNLQGTELNKMTVIDSGGSINDYMGGYILYSGPSATNYYMIYSSIPSSVDYIPYDKNLFMSCVVSTPNTVDTYYRIFMGLPSGNVPFLGFVINENSLGGVIKNSSGNEDTVLTTITQDTNYLLELVYTQGSDVKFYVDTELKGSLSTYLPDGDLEYMFGIQCATDEDGEKTLRVNNYKIGVSP